jgi:hypothetical protein
LEADSAAEIKLQGQAVVSEVMSWQGDYTQLGNILLIIIEL